MSRAQPQSAAARGGTSCHATDSVQAWGHEFVRVAVIRELEFEPAIRPRNGEFHETGADVDAQPADPVLGGASNQRLAGTARVAGISCRRGNRFRNQWVRLQWVAR